MVKKILLVLLVALIIIQFIHPAKNQTTEPQPNHIGNVYAIPAEVKTIMENSCNDCHSNNTKYPWYSRLQPVDWWMANHVKDGKKELNFDEFTNKKPKYQYKKMEEVVEMIEEGEMPLKSYTWIHTNARLAEAEKKALINWAESIKDNLKSKHPLDSLVIKQ
ncbi:MAG TPA: heme-binding domain-containing protein [Chitinophagaceae bacterium]|nr:heme-binding domain-containing protein [Chitinophagaceae bacterium]